MSTPISDGLYGATDVQEYAANPGAPIDLVAAGPAIGDKRPARCIVPLADGTVAIKLLNSGGSTRTLTALKGVPLFVQALTIETATTVGTQVYW